MATEPEEETLPDWPRCRRRGCIGVRVGRGGACLAHSSERTRDAVLAGMRPEASLDLRGTPIDSQLLDRIRAATSSGERVRLGEARFERAQFSGNAWFQGTRFLGPASFDGARFNGTAWFGGTEFAGHASFNSTQFSDSARFERAEFAAPADFTGARFSQVASFEYASFIGSAYFDEARFAKDAWFPWATFRGQYANFYQAEFIGSTLFVGTRFKSEYASFTQAHFTREGMLGPMLVTGFLQLDRAVFDHAIHLRAVGPKITCAAARFEQAATIGLRSAELALDDSVFVDPPTISFATSPFESSRLSGEHGSILPGILLFDEAAELPDGGGSKPRLLSLRGVDAATLTLSDVDLSACMLAGAHHLDQLRIDGPRPFSDTPPGWQVVGVGSRNVPVWRWTRRQTVVEEHQWRAGGSASAAGKRGGQLKRSGWYPARLQPPEWAMGPRGQADQQLLPDRLAPLYRALRKAQEDGKNEPGAADFYYGEMEMRRAASSTPAAERFILWLYWLVSGYGLRAWRALASLLAIILLAALAFAFWGLPQPEPTARPVGVDRGQLVYELKPVAPASGPARLPEAILFSFQSATTLLRGPDRPLTAVGEYVEIALRFTGPVLFGLAVLSARNRIKR